ncbi:ABC transporter permease [Sphingobacterium sp. DK4209]|uniref:ABC transporter permease subunit n=1 Tax=Sphingobacterium zhuxiongii TaxID=2662364 RepID=A0A5Q0Q7Y4_9SPHI|nr:MULTISPECIES: ABC transporter permease [unclassified Sphingobacterium]MVZ65198.1 ABC transporter permease [Sphingobacterium sp. DK4209]QGA26145.1 ABC transporter permease subunit [Sphingobacterium sp. dk4302]
MRTLLFLLRKEFKQIFRNKALLPLIFFAPVMQLIILPLAADFEVKNINISYVDHDHSTLSQQLFHKLISSGYFRAVGYGSSYSQALQQIEEEKADIILEIPAGFERNLVRENQQELFIAINAINGVKAGLGGAYVGQIINDFNQEVRLKWTSGAANIQTQQIEVTSTYWFNPHLNYQIFMVPAILVILVTMICAYMCALNIVKEKEVGTIEQINVTPIKKYQFILGKLIPFWLIGIFIFTVGLFGIARFIYGIVPIGNILLLYAFLAIYLIALLGMGLLISTTANTQQQAMSVAFFFIMIFMLMSGLFTSIDSMPDWAKVIAYCSPVTYFIDVMRMLVLKGSGLMDIRWHFVIMFIFAIVLNTWALVKYKKTS